MRSSIKLRLAAMVRVRSATSDDLPELESLFRELVQVHASGAPEATRISSDPTAYTQYLSNAITGAQDFVLVAEVAERTCGFVHVVMKDAKNFPNVVARRFAYMAELAVAPAYRRRGVATELVSEAERRARSERATKMELGVWTFNAGALAFYEGAGYDTFNVRMWKDL